MLGDALVSTGQGSLALEPLTKALDSLAIALRRDRTNTEYLATFAFILRHLEPKITLDDLLAESAIQAQAVSPKPKKSVLY